MLKINLVQARKCKRLARRECCNYDKGYCLFLDDGERCRCIQEISCYGIYCKYFKEAVLPIDKKLFKEIMQQNKNLRRNKHNEKKRKFYNRWR